MPSNASETAAELSTNTSDMSAFSLSQLPEETNVGIAGYLDHESLARLGATCSPLRALVTTKLNPHWKLLHDKRWTSGNLLRFDGLPSQRPRGGIILNVEDRDWKEEFGRRFILDKSVPERLASFRSTHSDELYNSLVRDGADIYDKLKLLRMDPLGSIAAKISRRINQEEAEHDLENLRAYSYGQNDIHSWSLDLMMIVSKYGQSMSAGANDLMERCSSDQVYDDINRMLDRLTSQDVESFERVPRNEALIFAADENILIDKILKNRKGLWWMVDTISARVSGTPMPHPLEEWWRRIMRSIQGSSGSPGMLLYCFRYRRGFPEYEL